MLRQEESVVSKDSNVYKIIFSCFIEFEFFLKKQLIIEKLGEA